jgi:hypothetical protein
VGDARRPPQTSARGGIGWIVAGSLAIGLVTALVLVAAPFIEAKENVLTGMVLLAFAFGWALLAMLSVRFTDQPQRWAAAPAVFFTLAGLIFTHRVGHREPCARLGVAASTVRARSVDDHSCRQAATQPNPAVAAIPGACWVGPCLGWRRLRNRRRVDRCSRSSHARPAHRRRRAQASPELHRLR